MNLILPKEWENRRNMGWFALEDESCGSWESVRRASPSSQPSGGASKFRQRDVGVVRRVRGQWERKQRERGRQECARWAGVKLRRAQEVRDAQDKTREGECLSRANTVYAR